MKEKICSSIIKTISPTKLKNKTSPNLKKEKVINVQEAYRTPNRLDQKRKSCCHITIKTLTVWDKERILKASRGKCQVTYKARLIRIIPDFSTETLKAMRAWTDGLQNLR